MLNEINEWIANPTKKFGTKGSDNDDNGNNRNSSSGNGSASIPEQVDQGRKKTRTNSSWKQPVFLPTFTFLQTSGFSTSCGKCWRKWLIRCTNRWPVQKKSRELSGAESARITWILTRRSTKHTKRFARESVSDWDILNEIFPSLTGFLGRAALHYWIRNSIRVYWSARRFIDSSQACFKAESTRTK